MNTILFTNDDLDAIHDICNVGAYDEFSDKCDQYGIPTILDKFIFNECKLKLPNGTILKVYMKGNNLIKYVFIGDSNFFDKVDHDRKAEFLTLASGFKLINGKEGSDNMINEIRKTVVKNRVLEICKGGDRDDEYDSYFVLRSTIGDTEAEKSLIRFANLLMRYILVVQYEYKAEIRSIPKTESTGEKKTRSPRSSSNTDKVLTLRQLVKYKSPYKGNKHIITCESWGVRGHYRKLKSGKVIFIQSFKKGKNRNADTNDKTFVI